MATVRRLLLLFILVTAVMAASKCGKRALRSMYGKQTTFQSVQQKSRCKYRLRTTPGLHIKLVLDNYHPQPCCLKVTISPRGAKKLPIPAGPLASLIVESSDVDVIIKSSSAARPVNISHEAVIPADGHFGFAFRATRKPRVIRTPDFPKTKLPSGVRAVWNVTTSSDRNIHIKITGLSTSANQDFLEIFDGPVLLGKYSGKKKIKELPITHRAFSGNMVIVLETQTDQSKGFRAKIVAKDLEDSDKPAINSENRQAIQCHKRTRVTSNGGVISDDHSRMTCNIGEVCGRMLLQGSTIIGGTNLSVTTENLHCIPQSLCTGNCGEISPPDESIIIKSCELSCCSTDMCNKSPDAPDTPILVAGSSAPLPSWLSPQGGLRCHEGSSVRREFGGGIGSGSDGDTCPASSVCALYVFSGVSNDGTMEKVVGYVTKCTPEAECVENNCSNLEEVGDANFSICNVTCCKTSYCNDPYEAIIPTLPPREPTATSCFSVKNVQIGDNTPNDERSYMPCSDTETRCLRVDAYVKNSDGKHGVASVGKCIAKSACDNLNCSDLLGLDESITATSCVAECCHNDWCNEVPLSIPVPSDEENGLWCHSQSVFVQEGAIQYSGERTNTNQLCNDGEVCAYFKYYGTSTEYHQIGESMAGYGAMCQPPSACNENTCQTLPNARDIKVTSCEASCCNTSMCNEPGEPPMPSPRTPVKGFSSQCYTIIQTSVNGRLVTNQTSVSTCSAGSACLRIDATTMHSGLAVKVVYGSCIPKISCSFANCDIINGTIPGIPIRDCRINCCDTGLCNNVPVPSETAPAVYPSPSESSSTESSESSGSAKTNKCYDTMQMRSLGVLLPGSKKDVVACEPNSQCFKMTTVASHSSLPGVTVKTTIGGCAPKATCAARTCTGNPTLAMHGTVVESCETSCCDGDLCNN